MALAGKVAVITGASRGIGRECALTLAKAGCDIVVAAKSVTDTPNLPGTIFQVAQEVKALGKRSIAIQVDVRDEKSVEAMVDKTIAEFGRLDILINNAGALWWKKLEDTPMKRYDLINGVNSRGTFVCTQKCLPHMKKNGWGHIINMSPPLNAAMLNGKIAYSISKFGMTLQAHGLAQELGGTGIACNALWPATAVESYATLNFGLGGPSVWRKASIIADSVEMICKEDPKTFTGHALIDEDYMRSRGITDFSKYQCVPGSEPPRLVDISPGEWERGFARDAPKAKL
uniref:Hydroxysteroid dehydrogenase-like protein 2 n=1 Tax=Paramoeba aestuarina TaxID=180227 RepID=A0A7S4KQM1_9EUKA|mmetsp:Transcript_23460/g.36590  ORF Transcript_23460/g.36590 Transcript_23460/m.36590 type:complete len:287 (+) Transcript_23460:58-918(+)|eukprot:CAMPEP_0201541788 /NCGR_PEP_ID=MMETSP0161_2-20130828/71665_1 /ASSEMBLY_ACC=CAM_ASM_000251 /TAXON_ID=180227 /ORGANISM="Neoparamoeba aestuarina, Strain SoJaBio B1-5/56/2" /LENGTH=286 /DNA_ID=CAMNT_0047949347 /DNA_START=71 /DNA_END=931 /DNA_ORIENTATION=+